MKKFLSSLFLAAMLTAVTTASAEVLFTYDFNDQSTWSEFSYIGGNSGQTYTSYSEDSFDESTGMVAIVGAGYVNASDSWQSGTTLVNLGGDIGQVLCLSSSTSIINGILKKSLGEGLDSITNACSTHWSNIIFYLSDALTPSSGTSASETVSEASELVKISIVLNVWDGSATSSSATAAISQIDALNSYNNQSPSSVSAVTVNGYDFLDENGYYDPTKWMTYEIYGWSAAQLSARIKLANTGTNRTIFIKSVTFETVDAVTDSYDPSTATSTLRNWTLSYVPTTDSESVAGEDGDSTDDDTKVLVLKDDDGSGSKTTTFDASEVTTDTEFTITIGDTNYYLGGSSIAYNTESTLTSTESGTSSLSAVPSEGTITFAVKESDEGDCTLTVTSSVEIEDDTTGDDDTTDDTATSQTNTIYVYSTAGSAPYLYAWNEDESGNKTSEDLIQLLTTSVSVYGMTFYTYDNSSSYTNFIFASSSDWDNQTGNLTDISTGSDHYYFYDASGTKGSAAAIELTPTTESTASGWYYMSDTYGWNYGSGTAEFYTTGFDKVYTTTLSSGTNSEGFKIVADSSWNGWTGYSISSSDTWYSASYGSDGDNSSCSLSGTSEVTATLVTEGIDNTAWLLIGDAVAETPDTNYYLVTSFSNTDYKFETLKTTSTSETAKYAEHYYGAVIFKLDNSANSEFTSADGTNLTVYDSQSDNLSNLTSTNTFYIKQGNTGNQWGRSSAIGYGSNSATDYTEDDGWYEFSKGGETTTLTTSWTESNSDADYMLFLLGMSYETQKIVTTDDGGIYVTVLLATEDDITSGIENIDADGNVILAETYYTIQGVQVQNPEDSQFYIVVRKYADGSIKAFKQVIIK